MLCDGRFSFQLPKQKSKHQLLTPSACPPILHALIHKYGVVGIVHRNSWSRLKGANMPQHHVHTDSRQMKARKRTGMRLERANMPQHHVDSDNRQTKASKRTRMLRSMIQLQSWPKTSRSWNLDVHQVSSLVMSSSNYSVMV